MVTPGGQRGGGRVLARRYHLQRVLGRGAMGAVWEAEDTFLRRTVAVKEVVLPGSLSPEERAVSCERTLREARAIARLGHPNVVTLFDVLDEDARPWVVMELVPSRSLAEVIKEDGPLHPLRVATVGLAVLGALEAAHAAGITHRDVKPGNILLGHDGRVKLTDFGIARAAGDDTITGTGLLVGSPSYIAPEIVKGHEAGAPADLWGLGATLYAAVEGRAPFSGGDAMETLAKVVQEPPTPYVRAGALGPALDGMLEKDPAKRSRPVDARRMLLDVLRGGADAEAPRSASRPSTPPAGATRVPPEAAPSGPGLAELLVPVWRQDAPAERATGAVALRRADQPGGAPAEAIAAAVDPKGAGNDTAGGTGTPDRTSTPDRTGTAGRTGTGTAAGALAAAAGVLASDRPASDRGPAARGSAGDRQDAGATAADPDRSTAADPDRSAAVRPAGTGGGERDPGAAGTAAGLGRGTGTGDPTDAGSARTAAAAAAGTAVTAGTGTAGAQPPVEGPAAEAPGGVTGAARGREVAVADPDLVDPDLADPDLVDPDLADPDLDGDTRVDLGLPPAPTGPAPAHRPGEHEPEASGARAAGGPPDAPTTAYTPVDEPPARSEAATVAYRPTGDVPPSAARTVAYRPTGDVPPSAAPTVAYRPTGDVPPSAAPTVAYRPTGDVPPGRSRAGDDATAAFRAGAAPAAPPAAAAMPVFGAFGTGSRDGADDAELPTQAIAPLPFGGPAMTVEQPARAFRAQPSSGPPDGFPDERPPTDRRRRSLAALLVVLGLVAAVVLGGVLLLNSVRGDGGGNAGDRGGGASASAGPAAVPGGYTLYRGSGFAVGVPTGWASAVQRDGVVDVKEPGSTRFLRLITVESSSKALKQLTTAERQFAADPSYGQYQRVRLESVDYRGLDAADWEFTFTLNGVQRHVVYRGIVTGGRTFGLYLSTPQDLWAQSRGVFQTAADTFRTG